VVGDVAGEFEGDWDAAEVHRGRPVQSRQAENVLCIQASVQLALGVDAVDADLECSWRSHAFLSEVVLASRGDEEAIWTSEDIRSSSE